MPIVLLAIGEGGQAETDLAASARRFAGQAILSA